MTQEQDLENQNSTKHAMSSPDSATEPAALKLNAQLSADTHGKAKPFPMVLGIFVLFSTCLVLLLAVHLIGIEKFNLGPDFGNLMIMSAALAFICGAILFLAIQMATAINFMMAIYAAFAGMFGRIVLTIAFCLLAFKFWDFSPKALVISQAIFYLPMLVVETAFVGRYFWVSQEVPEIPTKKTNATEKLQAEVSA